MSRHRKPITVNPIIRDAVTAALQTQPWWARRKDTIAAIAGTILQILNVAFVAFAPAWPSWAAGILALAIGAVQIIVHAATKGAITPSMGRRLSEAAETTDAPERLADQVAGILESRAAPEPARPALPVWDAPTTAAN